MNSNEIAGPGRMELTLPLPAARPSPSPSHHVQPLILPGASKSELSPGWVCVGPLKADATSPGPCPTLRESHVL